MNTAPSREEPSRLERMVGEIIGLRMLVSGLLADLGPEAAMRILTWQRPAPAR